VKRVYRQAPLAVALLLLGAACTAASKPPQAPPTSQAETGYLSAEARPDERVLIPPPPADGSAAAVADLAVLKATRALEGTPRWQLASRDNTLGYGPLVGDFSCALGAAVDPNSSPAVHRLLNRATLDVSPLIGSGKERYKRPRPFRIAKGPVCIDLTPDFAASGSYPSGHSAVGWTFGLILAELAPDRAAEILARARVFGESRVVCGVHYASDVEAGRAAAEAVFTALQSNPGFQKDLAAARPELSSLRAAAPAPDAARCALENETGSHRPW
jgi:acid phosphatase (class A)